MKIKALWIAVLAALMVSSIFGASGLTPAAAQAPASQISPPAPLSMAAARNVTRAIAWEVARRNGSVNSVKVGTCRRLTAVRIACAAVDRGSTSTLETTCRLRVQVRLRNGKPTGSLTGVHCDNQSRALLRASEAEAAMLQWAEQGIPGQQVQINLFGRRSHVEIAGIAHWLSPSAPNAFGICTLELTATLTESGEIEVKPGKSACIP